MVVDQYRIEKKGLHLNEAWVDGVAIKVGTSLVKQSWESPSLCLSLVGINKAQEAHSP